MPKIPPLILTLVCSLLGATAAGAAAAEKAVLFNYKDASGNTESASVISKYYPKKIEHTFAKIDRRFDPKLMRAATIAQERAHAHSRARCWQYVKEALLASGVV